MVAEADIERLTREPPPDTRAYARAMLLRRAGAAGVADVDWDAIKFRVAGGNRFWFAAERTLAMPDPLALTRAETEAIFHREETDLDQLLDELMAAMAM